jgi:hypothetical protein
MDASTSLLEDLFSFIRHFLPGQDIAFNTLKIVSIGAIGLFISPLPLSVMDD